MAKGKRHTRKVRRQWAAFLKWGPGAKPIHESPKGRTGMAHRKSRSRPPKKVLRELERLIFGHDWSKRK